eukprot:38781-Alexandrium_andersonii.AAC.1
MTSTRTETSNCAQDPDRGRFRPGPPPAPPRQRATTCFNGRHAPSNGPKLTPSQGSSRTPA